MKRTVACKLLVTSLFIFVACSRDPQKMLASGKRYIAERKFNEAAIELRSAVNVSPQLAEAHYQLGLAYAGLGQLSGAKAEFEKTLGIAPTYVAAQLKSGNLLLLERRFEEARRMAELVLDADTAHVRAHILLANSYAGIIDMNDSIDELKWAFEVEPKLLPAYLDLAAMVTNFQRQPDLAETAYKKAIATDARSVPAQLALANFYVQSHRFDEAEKQFSSVLAMEPASRDARLAMAFFYFQTKKFDLAERIHKHLADSQPNDFRDRLILADYYEQTGETKKGIDVLQMIMEKEPEHALARRRTANLLLTRKEYSKAAELADQALKKNENDLESRFIKCRILLAQKKTSQAITELQTLVETRPALQMGRYLLGIAYVQAQDFSRAETELLVVIQNDASFSQAYVPLANLRLTTGDMQASIHYARQALAFNPSLAEAHLVLARAYIGLKDFKKASKEVSEFMKAKPGSAAGLYHQGILQRAEGNLTEAERQFEAALAADDQYVESLEALSHLLVSQGLPEKAVQRINRAIALHPENARYYQILAQAYATQGNTAKGEEFYKKAISANASDMSNVLAMADFYTSAGDFQKSIDSLLGIVRQEPGNFLALKRLQEVYLSQKEYGKATETADRILKVRINDTDALVLKGRVLLAQSRFNEAVVQLQIAVKNESTSVSARYYLGYAHLLSNDRQRADSEWTEAVKTAGHFLLPYVALAQLKLDNGDKDAAARYARQALSANPDLADARFIVAMATQDVAELNSASSALDAVVKRQPADLIQRQRLGLVLLAQGEFTRAEAQFEAILKVKQDSRDALSGLVRVYVAQQHPEKAVQRLSRFPQLLAEFYISRNDYTKAEEVFRQSIAANLHGKDAKDARRRLALFFADTHQLDKSIAAYEDVLKSYPEDTASKRKLAGLYLSQKSFDRAFQLVNEILEVDIKDGEAHVLKGRVFLAQEKRAEAIAELQTTANSNRDSASARFFLGLAYRQDGKYEQAESAWNETIRIEPRFVQARLALAQLKLVVGDAGQAIRYAEDALKVDPKLVEAKVLLGDAQMQNRKFESAAIVFEALVKQNPTSAVALQRLGSAYVAQGDLRKAETQFDAALRAEPSNILVTSLLVNIYLQQKNPEKAIQRVNQQSAQFPNQSGFHQILGQIYVTQKNYSKAEEAYRKALAIDNRNLEVYGLLGQLFVVQNSLDKAVLEFENAVKIDPRSVAAQTMLGQIFEMKNAPGQAQVHYREALKLDPQAPVAANNLAWILAESRGNLNEALALARTAVEKLPNSPNVLDTMGWIYYKKGAYMSAVDLFKECINKAPNNSVYHFHLGLSYFQTKKTEEARASLLEAIRLNPAFPGVEDARSTLAKLQ